METPFTQYLRSKNWHEKTPLSFWCDAYKDVEIFFDTSNQIEIYQANKLVCTHYLASFEVLIDLLEKLK